MALKTPSGMPTKAARPILMIEDAIEPLDPHKAADLVQLLAQVQRDHVAMHPDIFEANPSADSLRRFLQEWLGRDGIYALVARSASDGPIGYVIYQIVDKPRTALKKARRFGMLHHVVVDRAHQRLGIGLRLIEAMKGRLRDQGITCVRSEHYAFNGGSAALMKAAGLSPMFVTVEGETEAKPSQRRQSI